MNRVSQRCTNFLAAAVSFLAISLASASASATEPGEAAVAVGEVAETPGLDSASMRTTAEGELAQMDMSKLPAKKRYLVSLSFARSSVGDGVSCTVSAMLRDAKTGNMIAIIEAGAQAAGTKTEESARRVATAAVRSAMRRIPTAFTSK